MDCALRCADSTEWRCGNCGDFVAHAGTLASCAIFGHTQLCVAPPLDRNSAPDNRPSVPRFTRNPHAWLICFLCFVPLLPARTSDAPAPAPLSSPEFLTRVLETAETEGAASLRQLLSNDVPEPAEATARYDYYATLAHACLDARLWSRATQMIKLAGDPPAGAGNRSWIAGLAYIYLDNPEACTRIASRYPKESPARDFLEAATNYFEWRDRGPADAAAAKLHDTAWKAIVRATRDAIRQHPDYSPRFLVLYASIVEGEENPVYFENSSASRASAFPRRPSFLRARLAGSWALEPEEFTAATSAAGFSAEEVQVWQRYLEVRARDIDALASQAAAKLSVLPERPEFDEARLISLRYALKEITDKVAEPEIVPLARRYTELAAKLNKPADALRALRLIDARRTATPADYPFNADTEIELAKIAGDRARAIKIIHAQAKTQSTQPEWLKRHVSYVVRHDSLRAAHAFLHRLTQMEPDQPGWKIALADLPDRVVDLDRQLADAAERVVIAEARLKLTPEQLDAEPETVLTSTDHRLTLYAQIFAEVPGKFVPPSRTWVNYEKVLSDSANHPLLEREYAEQSRLVFRKIVERCYKERPDHPVIAAQHKRLVAADEAAARTAKAQAEAEAAAASRAARAAGKQSHNSTATVFLNSVRSAEQLKELNKKKEQRKAYLLRTVGDGDTLLEENNKISEVDRENSLREWEGRKTIRVADRRVKNDFDLARYQRLRRRLCADCSGIGLAPPKSVPGGTRYFKCQTCSGDGLSKATGWQVGPNENPRIEEAPFRFLESFTVPREK